MKKGARPQGRAPFWFKSELLVVLDVDGPAIHIRTRIEGAHERVQEEREAELGELPAVEERDAVAGVARLQLGRGDVRDRRLGARDPGREELGAGVDEVPDALPARRRRQVDAAVRVRGIPLRLDEEAGLAEPAARDRRDPRDEVLLD